MEVTLTVDRCAPSFINSHFLFVDQIVQSNLGVKRTRSRVVTTEGSDCRAELLQGVSRRN